MSQEEQIQFAYPDLSDDCFLSSEKVEIIDIGTDSEADEEPAKVEWGFRAESDQFSVHCLTLIANNSTSSSQNCSYCNNNVCSCNDTDLASPPSKNSKPENSSEI